ncbi:DUF1492 domain-containing protein [Chloroflexota bacterium]
MDSDPLFVLTLYTNFIGMAFSLWFAIYLLARSNINHLVFRAIAALLAMAFYYHGFFTWMVDPAVKNEEVRSVAIVIALIAAHDLTHYLLPPEKRAKLYWLARGIVLLSVVIIVLHFQVPATSACDPRYLCAAVHPSLWTIIGLFQLLVYAAIMYNLWQIKQRGDWGQNIPFYVGVLLGASTIGYGFIGEIINTTLNINLPRFIATGLVLGALALLGYSVSRHQALVTRRTTTYDLPVTLGTISVIVGLYALVAWQARFSWTEILLLAVLVIFTHSAYDFVRESLDRLFRRQERQIRKDLREIGRDISQDSSFARYLRRALAILCHNMQASSGFIAIREPGLGNDDLRYRVAASYHSLQVGAALPPHEIILDEVSQPRGLLSQDIEWLAPAYGGGQQVALVGLGPCKGQRTYSEGDLFWLQDVADELGAMVYTFQIMDPTETVIPSARQPLAEVQKTEPEQLLAALAYRPDPDLVKSVEEGFRNIHDYSKLGRSPLVDLFDIQAQDHIERGKQVQHNLIELVEKLRPGGAPPREPLPREWHSYTILHDAYINEKLARDIMGKLYISEGTYYRTRRRALRGVARALLEVGAVT